MTTKAAGGLFMQIGRSFWELSSIAATSSCTTLSQDPAGIFLAISILILRLVNVLLKAMSTSTGETIFNLKIT